MGRFWTICTPLAVAVLLAASQAAVTLIPQASSTQLSPQDTEIRISRIEDGLLPAAVVQGQSLPRMLLADRMKYYRVPGVSIAVFDEGQILWARGYGLADIPAKRPVTPETLFQAASVSKSVTAFAALQLVQQGKLALDEDVNRKLLSWKVPENEFTKNEKVTLRRLLSHTAGMNVTSVGGYFTQYVISLDAIHWNYALVSTDGKRTMVGRIPNDPNLNLPTEWVAYSPSLESPVWSRRINNSHRAIETPSRTIVKDEMFWEERVVASPDGRYLAVFRQDSQMDFRVYDLRLQSWTDLGMMSIHPDGDWWYIQPDWNPWFADGSRLVFLRNSTLVIATPDSTEKIEIKIDGSAGLPVPSPDGKSIAYVTFEPRPKQMRPDLQFWGGTTIMVVGTSGEPKPRAVTTKNPDEVYDLKWLNNDALIFDRVADDVFYQHARIWKVAVLR